MNKRSKWIFSIFDSFEKQSGRTVFYPYGRLWDGYVLETEQQEDGLRKLLRLRALLFIPLVVIVFVLIHSWILWIPIVVYILYFHYRVGVIVRSQVKDCNQESDNDETK